MTRLYRPLGYSLRIELGELPLRPPLVPSRIDAHVPCHHYCDPPVAVQQFALPPTPSSARSRFVCDNPAGSAVLD